MKNIFYKLAFCTFAIMAIDFNFTISTHAASAGSLDSSFGTSGIVNHDVFQNEVINDVAIQDDGKTVAVGSVSGIGDWMISRYLTDGNLDTTFGGDGIVFVNVNTSAPTESARNVAIQPDGKIVVTGGAVGFGGTGVVRLNLNGSLDTGFATTGILNISFLSTIRGLEIQSDGKIVIGGTDNSDFKVSRLNPNGTFDTSFGNNSGSVSTNGEAIDSLNDLDIDPFGRIVVVGKANVGTNPKSIVIRYTSAGLLDTSFNGDGIFLNDFDSTGTNEELFTLDAVSTHIIVKGKAGDFNTIRFVKLTNGGNLDTTFGSGGAITQSATTIAGNGDVIALPNGKTLSVGGSGSFSTSSSFVIYRLNSNGSFDTSFGSNGRFRIRQNVSGESLKLSGDKAVIGGVFVGRVVNETDVGLARVNLFNTPTQSGDFDGDGFTDTAVYRPSTGNWFVLNSSNSTVTILQFGSNGDIPIDGDFDGDGRNDLAVYKPTLGQWWFQRSSDNTVFAAQFGTATDKPVSGDYDKDGKTDIAIFRPATGEWLILRSSSNFSTFFGYAFGANGDIPIVKKEA
jgi:uncharacterized delta-60 repeat protein